MEVRLQGANLTPTGTLPDLPRKITEISGKLSILPLMTRTKRDMSEALYAVVHTSSEKVIPYKTRNVLGVGTFSTVYELVPVDARHHSSTYALKAFNRCNSGRGGPYLEMERRLADHPDMTGIMVPACNVKNTFPLDDLLMSQCEGCLRTLLEKLPPQPSAVAEDVAKVVFALESSLIDRGYIHTDIHMYNLLYCVSGKNDIRLLFGDYGGLHRIGWKLQGCCTIALPEHNYAPYINIATKEDAIAAAKFLAAAAGCAVLLYEDIELLYDALCYEGASFVKKGCRDESYAILRQTLLDKKCPTLHRWLERDPSKRNLDLDLEKTIP